MAKTRTPKGLKISEEVPHAVLAELANGEADPKSKVAAQYAKDILDGNYQTTPPISGKDGHTVLRRIAAAEAEHKAGVKKTTCPVTREQFRAKAARSLAVTINGVPMAAGIKEFSTKSFGYFLNGKTVIDVDGTPVTFQIGLNLTAIGSKELPE